MADCLMKCLLDDEIQVIASDTTAIAEKARLLHKTLPVSTAVLGRTLALAVLMASQLKEENQKLTIQINGNGPAGTIMATANAKLEVKGYVANPYVNLPAKADGQLDVGGAVGKDGFFTVIKDMGLKEPYVGKVPLQTGEIAEDAAFYFLKSEQQPSIVYLSAWVDIDTTVLRSGGLLITPLPGASEETLAKVERKISKIYQYGMMLLNQSPEEAVRGIFDDMNVKLLQSYAPQYVCDCSRERLEQVILSLGKEEIEKMIQEDGKAEIVCRFCNKKYQFDQKDLQRLLVEAGG